jgi:hypothetical protein
MHDESHRMIYDVKNRPANRPSTLSKFCCKKATHYPSIHQNLFILIHNSSKMDPIVPVGLALRLKNISTAL